MPWKFLPSLLAGGVLAWAPYAVIHSEQLLVFGLALGCYGLCPLIIGRAPQRVLLIASLLPHVLSTLGVLATHPAVGQSAWWLLTIVLLTLTLLLLLPLVVLIMSLHAGTAHRDTGSSVLSTTGARTLPPPQRPDSAVPWHDPPEHISL